MGLSRISGKTLQDKHVALIAGKQTQTLDVRNANGAAIDATYFTSPHSDRTGNVVVVLTNDLYQNRNPNGSWTRYLDAGADVVLMNQTEMGGVHLRDDLEAVLGKLRADNPNQHIAIYSYCASSDPAIAAAAQMNDPNIHCVVDRGHGDFQTLARKTTIVAKFPFVRSAIDRHFDCRGIDRVSSIRGRMMFLAPDTKLGGADAMMDIRRKWCGPKSNLTMELFRKRGPRQPQDRVLRLSGSHWSPLGETSWREVMSFLQDCGIVNHPERATNRGKSEAKRLNSCMGRVVPCLQNAWC